MEVVPNTHTHTHTHTEREREVRSKKLENGLVLIGLGEQPNTREWKELGSFKKTDQTFIQ